MLYFSFAVTVLACGSPTAKSQSDRVTDLTIAEVHALDVQGLVILDVRTPGEVAQGTLPDAINIDWNGNDFSGKVQATISKETPVLVYCQAGGRSAKAVAKLEALGYRSIYHMHEGFRAWEPAKGDH